ATRCWAWTRPPGRPPSRRCPTPSTCPARPPPGGSPRPPRTWTAAPRSSAPRCTRPRWPPPPAARSWSAPRTPSLEARQLWSAAAAMCLALLPVVVVVAGLWMGIAGLITGAQWALDVDGSVWLGVGRWLVVAVGLAGAGYALFAYARWIAGLVETWRGRGMPKWPSWLKR